jgi:hypothetical protein
VFLFSCETFDRGRSFALLPRPQIQASKPQDRGEASASKVSILLRAEHYGKPSSSRGPGTHLIQMLPSSCTACKASGATLAMDPVFGECRPYNTVTRT